MPYLVTMIDEEPLGLASADRTQSFGRSNKFLISFYRDSVSRLIRVFSLLFSTRRTACSVVCSILFEVVLPVDTLPLAVSLSIPRQPSPRPNSMLLRVLWLASPNPNIIPIVFGVLPSEFPAIMCRFGFHNLYRVGRSNLIPIIMNKINVTIALARGQYSHDAGASAPTAISKSNTQ
jgi:hypothetical protein